MYSPQERIAYLSAEVTRHNRLYHLGEPEISDAQYDALYRELVALEQLHPAYVLADTPTKYIQTPSSSGVGQVFKHTAPMLSIKTDTSYSEEVPIEFDKYVRAELKREGIETQGQSVDYIGELKYDGLAINLVYVYGTLTHALIRGDGYEGEDCLYAIRHIRTIPKKLSFQIPLLEVRGEVLLNRDQLSKINSVRENLNLKKYANPRNAAAGIIRTLDGSEWLYSSLIFATYGIGGIVGHPGFKTQLEMLKTLSFWGFPVYTHFDNAITSANPEKLKRWFNQIDKRRDQIPFDIDGVVYKVNDLALRAFLGFNAKEPKWAIAHKFPPQAAITTLRSIELQVGRTGSITPVAKLDPVRVGGVEVSSITMHNEQEINRKRLRIGDQVMVHRAGDVVPEIIGPVVPVEVEDYTPYSIAAITGGKCPVCNGPISKPADAVIWRCVSGWSCKARLLRAVEHFAARPALNIEGLGETVIRDLIDAGKLKSLSDIPHLDRETLSALPGFAELKTNNLLEAITASLKSPREDKLLFAFGIPGVGPTTARELLEQFGSIQGVLDNKECLSDEAKAFLSDDIVVSSIVALTDELKPDKVVLSNGPLSGTVFVVTGSFSGMSRFQVEDMLRAAGAKVASSVGKTTTHLLCGASPGGSLKKAQKLDLPVVDLDFVKTAIG